VAAPAEADRARAYDAWYETAIGATAHQIELRLIAELAAPERGERALDVGCGTGIYTAWLAEEGLEVTALDRDPAMLAAARAKAPGARLVEGDATSLPFAGDEFDLALAVTAFCFLDAAERRAAARELVRVVRPGGRVVVGELACYSLWAAQRRVKGWRGWTTWRSAHFTTAGALRRLFRDAGATAVHTRYGLYLPPWDPSGLARRAEAIERLACPLGSLGAAFVVACAELA
jgi:SAM-dependent methyltransferase